MANIDLPEKEIFNQRVRAVQGRIEGITKSNTMAGLLNNNFKMVTEFFHVAAQTHPRA